MRTCVSCTAGSDVDWSVVKAATERQLGDREDFFFFFFFYVFNFLILLQYNIYATYNKLLTLLNDTLLTTRAIQYSHYLQCNAYTTYNTILCLYTIRTITFQSKKSNI